MIQSRNTRALVDAVCMNSRMETCSRAIDWSLPFSFSFFLSFAQRKRKHHKHASKAMAHIHTFRLDLWLAVRMCAKNGFTVAPYMHPNVLKRRPGHWNVHTQRKKECCATEKRATDTEYIEIEIMWSKHEMSIDVWVKPTSSNPFKWACKKYSKNCKFSVWKAMQFVAHKSIFSGADRLDLFPIVRCLLLQPPSMNRVCAISEMEIHVISSLLIRYTVHLFPFHAKIYPHANQAISIVWARKYFSYVCETCVIAFQSLFGAHSISNQLCRKQSNTIGVEMFHSNAKTKPNQQ